MEIESYVRIIPSEIGLANEGKKVRFIGNIIHITGNTMILDTGKDKITVLVKDMSEINNEVKIGCILEIKGQVLGR